MDACVRAWNAAACMAGPCAMRLYGRYSRAREVGADGPLANRVRSGRKQPQRVPARVDVQPPAQRLSRRPEGSLEPISSLRPRIPHFRLWSVRGGGVGFARNPGPWKFRVRRTAWTSFFQTSRRTVRPATGSSRAGIARRPSPISSARSRWSARCATRSPPIASLRHTCSPACAGSARRPPPASSPAP